MREYFGNLLLALSEKILGRPACHIYSRRKYPGYRSDGCRGCSPFFQEQRLREFTHHFLVKNKFPYKGFSEHYLIVPKREVETILDLDEAEKIELITIIGTYEAKGYVISSQQFQVSKNGSIAHKHVHVLK